MSPFLSPDRSPVRTVIRELRGFLILWLTQSFSSLGSSMTNFALIVCPINSRDPR